MRDYITAFLNVGYLGLLSLAECSVFFFRFPLWRARWLLYSHYFLQAFWIHSRRAQNQEGAREGDLTYGETPFWTARKIILWSGAKRGGTLWDLGCGRGSMVLFAAVYFRMRAIGVDISPLFVSVGRLIGRKLGLENATWIQGDFLALDLQALPIPDIVYLASTTFSWETIRVLAKKLEALPSGVKVVSLSAWLPSPSFRRLDQKDFWFSWGKATAHLHERV